MKPLRRRRPRSPPAAPRKEASPWWLTGLEAGASALLVAGVAAARDGRAWRRPKVDSPTAIPAKGWREIAARVWADFNKDNISIIAAGVTYNIVLAVFPALAAFVAFYGLVADVNSVRDQIGALSAVLPRDILAVIGQEMMRLAQSRSGGLSVTLILGAVISLWSANGAMRAMMVGLNVAYEAREKRGFFTQIAVSLALTIGLLLFAASASVALGAGALVKSYLGSAAEIGFNLLRWPLLLMACIASLCVLYRFGPCRPFERWRWITWGSASATILWVAASGAFSYYISHFAHLGRTYGSLATAIAFMLWLWLSALIVLAGAELNAAIEHQSAGRSPSEPKGEAAATTKSAAGRFKGR